MLWCSPGPVPAMNVSRLSQASRPPVAERLYDGDPGLPYFTMRMLQQLGHGVGGTSREVLSASPDAGQWGVTL